MVYEKPEYERENVSNSRKELIKPQTSQQNLRSISTEPFYRSQYNDRIENSANVGKTYKFMSGGVGFMNKT